MYILELIFVICLLVIKNGDAYLKERPKYLSICHISDAKFNSCYASNFQTLFREWKDGVPGLKAVGSVDPLHVKRVTISQTGNANVNINAEFTNLVVTGVSTSVIKDARLLTKKDYSTKIKMFMPKIRYDCDYSLDGKIFSLPLRGKGKAVFETKNVLLLIHIQNKLRDEDDLTFADVDAVKVEIKEIEDFHIHLGNLFGGQKDLEDSANSLLNDNWRELWEALRSVSQRTIEAVLFDRIKKTLNHVPSNYFAADIPKAKDIYG